MFDYSCCMCISNLPMGSRNRVGGYLGSSDIDFATSVHSWNAGASMDGGRPAVELMKPSGVAMPARSREPALGDLLHDVWVVLHATDLAQKRPPLLGKAPGEQRGAGCELAVPPKFRQQPTARKQFSDHGWPQGGSERWDGVFVHVVHSWPPT